MINISDLIASLKKGQAVQLEKIIVGTKPLIELLRLLPGEYCRISANGKLEVETVRFISRKGKDGNRKVGYVRPRHYWNWFGLCDGAWLRPHMKVNPVILKPRKF